MKQTKKRYSQSFKQQVLEDYFASGMSQKDCSQKWNVSSNLLCKWLSTCRNQEKSVSLHADSHLTSEKTESNSYPTSDKTRGNSSHISDKKEGNSYPTSGKTKGNSGHISDKTEGNSYPTSGKTRNNAHSTLNKAESSSNPFLHHSTPISHKSNSMDAKDQAIADLRAENERLRREAAYYKLRTTGYERLLEIVKEEDGIDLLKKDGAKQ